MTRSEFIQKAAIAMAGNSNFTSSDCTLFSRSILHCAVKLYDEVKNETYFQDDEDEDNRSLLVNLADISDYLKDIKKAMEAPNGGELSTFQELIMQMISLGDRLRAIEGEIFNTNEKLDDICNGTDCIGEPIESVHMESIAGDLTQIKNALDDIRDSVADE